MGEESEKSHLLLSEKETKKALLSVLDAFDGFCSRHGLRYSLSCGTLLGAVRHSGFIPWDDDIDVCMPRPDYEKFLTFANALRDETGFALDGYAGLPLDYAPFCKILNGDICVRASSEAFDSYLWIDVFPVDGLPGDDGLNAKTYSRMAFWRNAAIRIMSKPECGKTPLSRLVRAVFCPVLRRVGFLKFAAKRMKRIALAISYEGSEYIGVLTWGVYGPGERMRRVEFERFRRIAFEEREYSCMGCIDAYLSGLYGDYTALPPIGERTGHGVVAWMPSGLRGEMPGGLDK